MSSKNLYLKQNVFIEPLINQWYAWPLLVPPHCLAMILSNLQLKIMQSYIRTPAMHANAVKNPKMLGGPFMDLPGNQSKVVQELFDKTSKEQASLLRLADAIRELENTLLSEAKGHGLKELYDKVPDELKGYVELGYDLNNNPSVRYLEGLLYTSDLYQPSRQTCALSILDQDDRAFALSTPRFPDERNLHYEIPFASDAYDRLFRMRETPGSLEDIPEFIPEDEKAREYFMTFFTEEAPVLTGRDRDQLGDQVRVKYCGHATVLLESKDVSIMSDALISYHIQDHSVPRYSYRDLPEFLDYVILTHSHQDHVMFETLLQLRHKIGTILVPKSNGGTMQDPSLKLILRQVGFKNVVELDEMESIEVPGGRITGLPFFGEHGDLHIRSKIAFHVQLNDKSAIFAADSNNLAPQMYDHIHKVIGKIDTIFLGMECQGAPLSWLYGPLLTKPLERKMDQSRRFDGSDCEKGMTMIKSLTPSSVFIYAMGQEPWLTFVSSIKYTPESKPIVESDRLVQLCRQDGLEAERLFGCKEIFL